MFYLKDKSVNFFSSLTLFVIRESITIYVVFMSTFSKLFKIKVAILFLTIKYFLNNIDELTTFNILLNVKLFKTPI